MQSTPIRGEDPLPAARNPPQDRRRPAMNAETETEPIRIGLLHSLSGTMAISEAVLLDAERMASDEINGSGGVLGRNVEPLIADGASTPETFAQRARELLEAGATSLFGCWTSASRK